MRYLAIDPGDRRTGLALGDDVTGLAGPLDVIHANHPEQRLEALLAVIRREAPDALVVGHPLNMDGSAGPAARTAEQLAQKLTAATGLAVHLQDERLSSEDADAGMARTGLTHRQKKARRDALAAAAILQRFLDQT